MSYYDTIMALYERVMARRGRLTQTLPSTTCPRCHMTSYNPGDIRGRYCGNCHEWHDR